MNTAILIQSSVKASPYKITEKNFDLKMKFVPPNYAPVTFNASDPEFTQRKCYLNRRIFLTTLPSTSCNNTIHVVITCEFKGKLFYTTQEKYLIKICSIASEIQFLISFSAMPTIAPPIKPKKKKVKTKASD